MTDGDALLAAVLEYPGEDTPRLVYADWLDENGQPERAEFVRVGVELADVRRTRRARRRVKGGWRKRTAALRRRMRELLALPSGPGGGTMGREWLGPAAHAPRGEWERGFVCSLWCTGNVWVRHADKILARHPVREVTILTWPDSLAVEFPLRWPRVSFRWPGVGSRATIEAPQNRRASVRRG